MRTVPEEISLCGCYIPSMFTLELGKTLDIVLSLHKGVRASAVVVTRLPNIGNGIDFIDMDLNDRMKLHNFMEANKVLLAK